MKKLSWVMCAVVAAGCNDSNRAVPDALLADASRDAPSIAPAALAIAPLSVDFGSIAMGQTNTALFTVTNTGATTSPAVELAVSGADFVITSNTCQKLAPAATCAIGVAFGPTTAGLHDGSLRASAGGSAAIAAMSGLGTRPGDLAVSPASTALGDVVVGQRSAGVATIVVTNSGTSPTGTLTVQAGGSDPMQFSRLTDGCAGQVLAGGATCTITAAFAPTLPGPRSAAFAIFGLPGGMVSAVVTGTGIAPAQLVALPAMQDFGSVIAGSTSANVAFTISNIGGQATGAPSATLGGAQAADFLIATNTCTTGLAPLASCSLMLRFSPSTIASTSGAEHATLTIAGAPGGTATSLLSGSGIAAGALAISPSVAQFADTVVGTTSAATTFMVTNGGGTPSGALATALASTGDVRVAADDCAGHVLAPGAACAITAVFAPTSPGVKSASLRVTGNPGGAIAAALGGNALPTARLTLSPGSTDFGTVGLGGQTAFATFTVANAGGVATGVPAMATSGTTSQFVEVDDCGAAIAPLGHCTIRIQFKPTQLGLAAAAFSVAATPGGSVTANVFGEGGQPAQLAVMPSQLGFASTLGDASAAQTFTIQNLGSATTGAISLVPGGASPADFTASSNCTTLAAGATCTATVAFAPAAIGTRTATLAVAASPGGTTTVALSGVAQPRLEILSVGGGGAVDPYDFATQPVGSTTTAAIVLRNNTTSARTLTATGDIAPPAQFALSGCTNVTIAAGGTCTGALAFAPTRSGASTGAVTYAIGSGAASAVTQHLTGGGASSLVWTAETTAEFGNIVVGQVSAEHLFDLTNQSNAATATGVAIATLAPPFAFSSTTCGAMLAPTASCTVGIRFSPATLALAQATLAASSSTSGDASLALAGTGVDPMALSLTPAPTAFGSVFAGAAKDITVVVTNPAGAQTAGPMTFSISLGAPGFNPGPTFTILNNASPGDCVSGATALPNGQTCNIRIRFAPLSTGGRASAFVARLLTVTASPGTPNLGVTSLLTATAVSTISIAPASFDFGTLQSGDTASHVFTVHNDSPTAVAFGSTAAVLGGTHTSMAIAADTCSAQTLLPNATCTLTATFSPTVQTVDAASLVVNTSDPTGVATAMIAAMGANRAPIDIGLTSSTIGENQLIGAAIGTLSTTDPDVGQTFTYSLPIGVADNASFAIVGTTLVTGAVFDFESKASYAILLRTTDQDGASFDKAFAIAIANLDDPPVAVDDVATVVEDTLTAIDVLANDTDQDGGAKQVRAVSATSAQGGTVTITGTGTGVAYKPPADFCTSNPGQTIASDSFTYTLSPTATAPLDPAKSTATVTVNVTCVDDAPIAIPDHPMVSTGSTTTLDVLANDTDVDCADSNGNLCGPEQISSVTPPVSGGTLAIQPGSLLLTYTPPQGLCGTSVDMFTYTLSPGGSTTTVTVDVNCSVTVAWGSSSGFDSASTSFATIPSGYGTLTISNTSGFAHSHGGSGPTIGIQLHNPDTDTWTTIYSNVVTDQEYFDGFTITFDTQPIDGVALVSLADPQHSTWHGWNSDTQFTFSP